MKTKSQPTQSMRDFFNRSDVKACQEIQKRNPYGSTPHRNAFNEIRRLADQIGAGEFIGTYDE